MQKQSRHINSYKPSARGEVSLQNNYPFRLNFYLEPPSNEISVEEFETFALDRLQVLKALESATIRNKPPAEVKQLLDKACHDYLPLDSNARNKQEQRRKDHVSHFILRLAYCRSEELRSWFLRQECALFRHRFEIEATNDKQAFLGSLNFSWSIVSPAHKQEILEELERCSGWAERCSGWAPSMQSVKQTVEKEIFFEVDFERVPDLVSRRAVYLRRGKAYVPMSEQISLVIEEFRKHLAKALEVTARALPRMDEDQRLLPVLTNINKQCMDNTYNSGGKGIAGKIGADDVDSLVHHFPPCMRHLHTQLREDKHLRHGGRMQYGLFLKGIGLTMDEALVFWRKAFSKITDDAFAKSYAYNVRHNYGQEGKRTDYTPYSCSKIIMSNAPSTGDHHGCPFRHFSAQNTEQMLLRYRVAPAAVREVMELVQGKHYQIACTKFFELTRPKEGVEGEGNPAQVENISHPNKFFEMSFSPTS
ncbi:DNA primase large subunit [Endogone sp. FLAS-F59071]|nr:DNA primase large subunit [Endogone sp. FLAS-F59071]|eukprot:RUS16956.1 DNA primase large subunit [Endogone sp. FLAS-F59071]